MSFNKEEIIEFCQSYAPSVNIDIHTDMASEEIQCQMEDDDKIFFLEEFMNKFQVKSDVIPNSNQRSIFSRIYQRLFNRSTINISRLTVIMLIEIAKNKRIDEIHLKEIEGNTIQ